MCERYIGEVRQLEEIDMIYAVNERTKEHTIAYTNDAEAALLIQGREIPNRLGEFYLIKADADGWIEWHGGECPLPEDGQCNIMLRGSQGKSTLVFGANFCGWSHRDNEIDIIAYRPVIDAAPQVTEWAGEGLPPVGTVCEYSLCGSSAWFKCEIISHSRLVIQCPHLITEEEDNGLQIVPSSTEIDFRPIRTDRDKWIDAAARVPKPCGFPIIPILEQIHDALKSGDLPQP